jgi:hypothetical protein
MLMIVGDRLVVGVMAFGVGVGMIMGRVAMPMFMGMDDNLTRAATFNTVLAADFTCAFTFRTLFIHNHPPCS